MDVRDQISTLEKRYQNLLAQEARAKATVEHAERDLQRAQQELEALGFQTVEEASAWPQEAAQGIQAKISEVSQALTDAGV